MSSIGRQFVNYAKTVGREVRDIPTAMGTFWHKAAPQRWSENLPPGFGATGQSAGDFVNRLGEVPKGQNPNPKYDIKPLGTVRNYFGQFGDVGRAIFTGKEGSPSKQYTSANPGILTSGTVMPGEKRTDK